MTYLLYLKRKQYNYDLNIIFTQQLQQASNNKQLGRSGNQAVWSVGGKEPVIYWLSGQPGAKEGKVQTNQGKVQTKQGKVLRLAKEA